MKSLRPNTKTFRSTESSPLAGRVDYGAGRATRGAVGAQRVALGEDFDVHDVPRTVLRHDACVHYHLHYLENLTEIYPKVK